MIHFIQVIPHAFKRDWKPIIVEKAQNIPEPDFL